MNSKAIAVYLDDSDKMAIELSWLYKTWLLYSLDREYDLVIYYNPSAEHRLKEFVNFSPNVRTVPMPYIRLSGKYKFLNSHYFCLSEYNEPLRKYSHLMKTDCDVFLTKNMRGFTPGKTLVGEGNFYTPYDTKKQEFIQDLCEDMGLRYAHMINVGASFFGETSQVLNTVSAQATITEKILSDYFLYSEIHEESGFHFGVASMIAGEMVVNHSFCGQHIVLYALDSKCWETTKMTSEVLHIHAWHTGEKWSKHKFFDGAYADWVVPLSKAFDNTANYCHWVATTSIEDIIKYRGIL